MHITAHTRAVELLGNGIVLLPIARGTKKPPRGCKWGKLTLADMQNPDHIALLNEAVAVAALLGPVSGDHIAIDFDTEPASQEFLSINPALETTLRTHGKRGCVLWLRMQDGYPACCKRFKDSDGNQLGEWRGGGNCYSIAAGDHESGGSYTVLHDAPPLVCRFSDIRWPADWLGIPTLDAPKPSPAKSASETSPTMQSAMQENVLASACPSACPSAWHLATGRFPTPSESDEELIGLDRLYDKFIDRHWVPASKQRNEFIVKSVPFLFHAMCKRAVMVLEMRYFDKNKHLFKGSRQQHRQEAEFHLRAVEERFANGLSGIERLNYDGLRNERERAAFRICRHLSKRQSLTREDCEGDQFVLTYEDLSERLLTNPKTAYRLMRRFISVRIAEIVRNGKRRIAGVRPQATVWRYCLASVQGEA